MAKKSINLKAIRTKLGLNQRDFWAPLGVTQSGGSRFETGRVPQKPIRILLELVYGRSDVADLKSGKLARKV